VLREAVRKTKTKSDRLVIRRFVRNQSTYKEG
jgi:hypothetical protein